jgi:hypothetical protein
MTDPATNIIKVPAPGQRLRLIMDVTYQLNGEPIAEMRRLLQRIVEMAAGEGLLTGETAAEVEQYSARTENPDEPQAQVLISDHPEDTHCHEYTLNKDAGSCWITIGNISVHLKRQDEGVAVDLFGRGAEGESIAGTWALYQEAEGNPDNVPMVPGDREE